METYLWKIDKEKLKKTNLSLYSNFINQHYKINLGDNLFLKSQWSAPINTNIINE